MGNLCQTSDIEEAKFDLPAETQTKKHPVN